MRAMKSALLPRAVVVTPNVPEAEALTGLRITTDEDRREAARRILALGPAAVVIKGGHFGTQDIVDLLATGGEFTEFRHERIQGRHTHGTGCTFAASIAASLALGRTLAEAIPFAQRYIAGAIRHSPELGKGHGPMNHFWETSS